MLPEKKGVENIKKRRLPPTPTLPSPALWPGKLLLFPLPLFSLNLVCNAYFPSKLTKMVESLIGHLREFIVSGSEILEQ